MSNRSRWFFVSIFTLGHLASGINAQHYISLVLTNRNYDLTGAPSNAGLPSKGANLEVTGGGSVSVALGGIVLASSSAEAGRIQGNSGFVNAPFTLARAANVIGGSAAANWNCGSSKVFCAPTVAADGMIFQDPMHVKSLLGEVSGQPPIYGPDESAVGDALHPVPGGLLTSAVCAGGKCEPGIYFAVDPDCNGCATWHPSGAPLRTGNNAVIRFAGMRSFERYVFVGGLHLQNGSSVSMGPGRYVFAGVLDPLSTPVFQVAGNVTLSSSSVDAGRILIFTDFRGRLDRNLQQPAFSVPVGSYAGQIEGIQDRINSSYSAWHLNPWYTSGLRHGRVDIQAGRQGGSVARLGGLQSGAPDELLPYGPVLFWQDQHNSYVWYDQASRVDLSCGGHNSPCLATPDAPDAPSMTLWMSAGAEYNGVLYQPRGAWLRMLSSESYSSPVPIIITGALLASGVN